MRRLLMSRLIMIFSVCSVNLSFILIFEIWNKQDRCPNLAVCPNIPDFTLHARQNYSCNKHNILTWPISISNNIKLFLLDVFTNYGDHNALTVEWALTESKGEQSICTQLPSWLSNIFLPSLAPRPWCFCQFYFTLHSV